MFRSIASEKFEPFEKFHMEFPLIENMPPELAEVHIITGVNGTGKTRLLTVISAFLENPGPLGKRLKGNPARFEAIGKRQSPGRESCKIIMDGGNLGVADDVNGFFEKLRRTPAFAYSGATYVADVPVTVMAEVKRPDRATCLAFNRPEDTSKLLLQAITNLKLMAAMESEDQNTEGGATKLMRALEMTISEVTGRSFRFKVTQYPNVSLKVRWGDAELTFNVLPDGLRSIIGWIVHSLVMLDVWLQGKSDPLSSEAIFLLDEIESHLHPAWQRKILPAFQRLFPKAQIFVATHSPFVIASLNHGWIHSLKLGNNGKVEIQKPIPANAGDSYISVVEDIMGIKEWYDPDTEKLLEDFRQLRDTAYNGDLNSQFKARELAGQIGKRSIELDFMMGRELNQMERQLAKNTAPK